VSSNALLLAHWSVELISVQLRCSVHALIGTSGVNTSHENQHTHTYVA